MAFLSGRYARADGASLIRPTALELIGEAATHIPGEIRENNPQIPWRMIIATRNHLIHGYLGIDNDTLWSIIQTDIPELLPLLQHLSKQHDNVRCSK